MQHRKLFLISNMYPGTSNLRYGIFVKRFEDAVRGHFNVERVVMPKKGGLAKIWAYFIIYSRLLATWFKSSGRDIVYIHFPLYFAPLLWLFAKGPSRLVLNFHGSDAVFDTGFKRLLGKFMNTGWMRTGCHVVVPSEHYKHRIHEVFSVPHDKIYVYPSGGVDKEVFYPLPANDEEVLVIGFISNFISIKGWAVFLEALRKVRDLDPDLNFRAVMVGDGPDKPLIASTILSTGLNVTLTGIMEQDELAKMYSCFHVFVFPTERESLGLVGIEALMCGIPVIASDVQGPNEYIVPGENGYLFRQGDPTDLASKILTFASLDAKVKARMKQQGLLTAAKYASSKVNIELISWLNTIIR